MKNFKKLFGLLDKKEKKQFVLLLILIFTTAIFDVIGLASILPLITILTSPELVETNLFLSFIYDKSSYFGIKNFRDFSLFFCIVVFFLLLLSISLRALTTFFHLKFGYMREYTIGKRLFEGYLNQSYIWFLNQHSGNLSKNILSEVATIVNKGIVPAINSTVYGIISISLLTLLLLINFKIAIIVFFILFLSYFIIYFYFKEILIKYGKERTYYNNKRFITISEAFTDLKQLKFLGIEKKYHNSFSNSAFNYAKSHSTSLLISDLPRYFIEAVIFGTAIILIFFLILTNSNFIEILPIISLYVVVSYRLLPALQFTYRSLSEIKYIETAYDSIISDFKNFNVKEKIKTNSIIPQITFKNYIKLKNVNFVYPGKIKPSLIDINLQINANDRIGIVGPTGCGKTTLVDIILGLLNPSKGSILIDGIEIDQNKIKSWRKNIGYVSQQIYLTNENIAKNIAYGVEPSNIDFDLVEEVAEKAGIHQFIKMDLKDGYKTFVGEKGIKLSGGQKQKICIARALYNNPNILILDEATNSLDNVSEKQILDQVEKLSKNMTVIMITHKLNTIKDFNKIFYLESGRIIDEGNFYQLMKNKKFKKFYESN